MEFPRRGEIYFIDQVSQLTIVAAITSNLRVARLPVGIRIAPKESGLPKPSAVHLGHLYTVDKRRLRQRVGTLSQLRLREVDRAIQVSLGLKPFEF